MSSTEALIARMTAIAVEMKDLGKAVAAALKPVKKGKTAAAKAVETSSTGSASSPPSTPKQPTSWQAWGKHLLPAKGEVDTGRYAEYDAFKASYKHPVNGSKQGVSIAYQQHRAYLDHTSADGGLTEEYAEFIAPFLEAKAAKAAVATPKKPKATATAAAPPAPLKPAKAMGGAGAAAAEEDEEDDGAVFSSSSSLVVFGLPPKPPSGGLARLPSLTVETAAVAAVPDEALAAARARSDAQLAKAGAAVPKVVKRVTKKAAVAAVVAAAPKAKAEVEPWDWNGRKLLKNIRNEVWAADGEGGRVWAGVYDPEADTMDEMVDEPTA